MADITANVVVSMPSQLFTAARTFKALAGGRIYLGKIDTDPTVPENQIQAYVENEDGSHTPIAQPILINLGGFPVYRGQIAKIVTVEGHSMAVYDLFGIQQFYFPNVLSYEPDQFSRQIFDLLQIPKYSSEIGKYSSAYVPGSMSFDIDASQPDFKLRGSGTVSAAGQTINLAEVTYDPAKENVVYAPGTFLRKFTGEPYPTRQNPSFDGQCYRFILSQGSKLDDDSKKIGWVTAVGNTVGCDPTEWLYVDAIGTNAMMYAERVSRSVAVGSESMAWFGASSKQKLIDNCHDFWRKPTANPYVPGEQGWNAADLETNFPGIGTRLADFTGYVTSSDDAGYSTGVGRDALNHIVAGIRNSAGGYAALQHLFSGSYNTAFGSLALQSMVFGDYNTGFGDQAGRYANDCTNCVFVGYAAGRNVKSSTQAVIVGDRAADAVNSANRAVIIGPQAGASFPASLDDKIIIHNQQYGGTAPAFSGDIAKTWYGTNINPDKVRAHWHVRDSDSGSTLTPAVGLMVEAGAAGAVTIETRNTGFGSLRFADPESNNAGSVEYSHGSDSLTLSAGATAKVRVENANNFVPMTDNAMSLGRLAFRWSQVYAGTGSVNTSDRRAKENEAELNDAELRVAVKCKSLIRRYKFKDAVAIKGDEARLHFGVIAQDVIQAFADEGLDALQYGIVCHDEWAAEPAEIRPASYDEAGNVIEPEQEITPAREAGDLYAIRYEELLCFIIAAI